MTPPEARMRLGECDVLLLGTIAGFVPDGERVAAAFESYRPDRVALGIPPEDIQTLRRLAADPVAHAELPETDLASDRLLQLLSRFGATRVPSPELEQAHRLATVAGIPIAAIDLDDLAHADAFTRLVKVRHIVRSNRREKRLLSETFSEISDPYVLATAWDEHQTRVKPLAAIERLRERHMAVRLRELAARSTRLLAVVPAARLPGVVRDVGAEN